MKKSRALVLAGLTLLFVAAGFATVALPREAHGQSLGSFGIRPTTTTVDAPSGGAYFTYDLVPGGTLSDEALVMNDGTGPISLKLYAADGVTAINGGTAFAAAEEERNGVRAWLSVDTMDIVLQPGESLAVPFIIQVPADATAGDHVAGLIVEAPPKAGPTGGLGAAVVERVGVAVVIHVPGPGEESLTLGVICLNQKTGSNYFEVPVTSDGSLLTRASGTLQLERPDGVEVFSREVLLGTVLPGDSTLLRMDAPFDPGPGDYVANLTLERSDGTDVSAASAIRIEDTKADGCQSAVAGAGSSPGSDDRPDGFFMNDGGGFPWLIVLLLGILAAAALLSLRELVWRRRLAEKERHDG